MIRRRLPQFSYLARRFVILSWLERNLQRYKWAFVPLRELRKLSSCWGHIRE